MPARRPHLSAQRAQKLDDLSRAVMIHVCKDKTLTYRTRGQPSFNGLALPVFSVDTNEEAQALQLLCCARQYGLHPLMPSETWYRLSALEFGPLLEIGDIDRVADLLRERYALIRAHKQLDKIAGGA